MSIKMTTEKSKIKITAKIIEYFNLSGFLKYSR